jgi:hypothetical protein
MVDLEDAKPPRDGRPVGEGIEPRPEDRALLDAAASRLAHALLGVAAARRHGDAQRGEDVGVGRIPVRGHQVVRLVAQEGGGQRVFEEPRLAVDDEVRCPGRRGGHRRSARSSRVHAVDRLRSAHARYHAPLSWAPSGMAPLRRPSPLRLLASVGMALVAAVLLAPGAAHANQYRVELTNLRSGLKADVMWHSMAPGQGVFLWPNNTSDSQEFDLLDDVNGYFRIRPRHSRQCLTLDPRANPLRNGTRIVQEPGCARGNWAAQWRRGWVGHAPVCDGEVCTRSSEELPVLINRQSHKCLDAANPSTDPPRRQAPLQQWRCIRTLDDWNVGNQLWKIGNEVYP